MTEDFQTTRFNARFKDGDPLVPYDERDDPEARFGQRLRAHDIHGAHLDYVLSSYRTQDGNKKVWRRVD